MTLAEMREALRAARAKAAEARELATKADATPEQRKAYTDAIEAAETALSMVKAAEREEALDATTTRPAAAPVAGADGAQPDGPWAQPKQTVKPEQKALMGIAAMHKASVLSKLHNEHVDPYKLLGDEGYTDFVRESKQRAQQQQKAGVFSTVSTSVLLPQPVAPEIIPILYPQTTFLQGTPKRVTLTGGVYRQARGVGSSTAAYVGEGVKKPVGAPTFDNITMRSHKLAGIVYVTNEAVKWTIGDLEAYIRADLSETLGLKMDSAMYFGTGTGATPLGIFNQAGITVIDAAGAGTFANVKAPTYTELDRIASRATLAMTSVNLPRNQRWRWVMGYRTLQYLRDLRDGYGNAIYPEVAGNNWKGIPVLVSNQILENGGATTDTSQIGLVDFGHVLFAEEEGMTMKSSTEASIDDGGTTVFLWQQNMSAILAEMEHDVALDQAKAVIRIDNVRWGAP